MLALVATTHCNPHKRSIHCRAVYTDDAFETVRAVELDVGGRLAAVAGRRDPVGLYELPTAGIARRILREGRAGGVIRCAVLPDDEAGDAVVVGEIIVDETVVSAEDDSAAAIVGDVIVENAAARRPDLHAFGERAVVVESRRAGRDAGGESVARDRGLERIRALLGDDAAPACVALDGLSAIVARAAETSIPDPTIVLRTMVASEPMSSIAVFCSPLGCSSTILLSLTKGRVARFTAMANLAICGMTRWARLGSRQPVQLTSAWLLDQKPPLSIVTS